MCWQNFLTFTMPAVCARLSLTDYNMLGVFSIERSTQTEDTEIVPINKIADDIQRLVKVTCFLIKWLIPKDIYHFYYNLHNM